MDVFDSGNYLTLIIFGGKNLPILPQSLVLVTINKYDLVGVFRTVMYRTVRTARFNPTLPHMHLPSHAPN